MHYNATLRVRELTQNIYDIGDEIAQYINNVTQAMNDWDVELVDDCLEELHEIIAEGRAEVRPGLVELNGLRQAFISGIRAGQMSNPSASMTFDHPGRTLTFLHAPFSQRYAQAVAEAHGAHASNDGSAAPGQDEGPANQSMASTAAWRMWMRQRNERCTSELYDLEEWIVEQTQRALESQSVLLQQSFSQAERSVATIVEQWKHMVNLQPTLAADMRGENPPAFLEERARVDEIVAKLARAKRAGETSNAAV
ncbi:hypothetical protein GC425_06625 [Corynebacterium sp. zg254]|uniref:Poly(3-hydroxyalkanoate) polymerase subunit PhaE n=1 Tax=Corynebacterium zhongnanshanii TaxID=2768834 RepID=A0ABQ6VDD1_9CORY|nr:MULTISPECIES: hypothetical protein [Corynebacterium]KAB3520909.1 hypothetical protein F8377_06645 [Corynebacterium zhongnanshanii]MCR5914538.1 hypothetical protein [Corynebacterium sp. zg254]